MKSLSLGFTSILGNLPSAQLANEPRTVLLKNEEPSSPMLRAGAKSAKLSKGESEPCIYGFIDLFANLCPVKTQELGEIPGTRMPQPTLPKQRPCEGLIDNNLELLQTQTFPPIADAQMTVKANAPVESPQALPISDILGTDGQYAEPAADTIAPVYVTMGKALDAPRPHNTMSENEQMMERSTNSPITRPEGVADGRPFQAVQAEKIIPAGSGFETGFAKDNVSETVNEIAQPGSRETQGADGPGGNDPSVGKASPPQSDVGGMALRATLSTGTETPKPKKFDNPLPTHGVAHTVSARKLPDNGRLHADSVEIEEANESGSGAKLFGKPGSEASALESPLGVAQTPDALKQFKKGWPNLKTATADDSLMNVDGGLSNRTVVETPTSSKSSDAPQLRFDAEQPVHSLKQMVRRMSMSAAAGQNRMQIQLRPEMFGGLKIDILSENGQVAIRMTADSALVKEIIEQNLHLLKTEFSHHGLEIVKFDVLVQNNADSWSASQQFTHFNTSQHQASNQSQAHFAENTQKNQNDDLMQANDDVKEQPEMKDGIDFFA